MLFQLIKGGKMLSKSQLAIIYMIASVACFSIMDIIVKYLKDAPFGQVLFMRFAFGMIPDLQSVYGSFVSSDGQFYLVSLEQTDLGNPKGLTTEDQNNLFTSSWVAIANSEIQAYRAGVVETSQVSK